MTPPDPLISITVQCQFEIGNIGHARWLKRKDITDMELNPS